MDISRKKAVKGELNHLVDAIGSIEVVGQRQHVPTTRRRGAGEARVAAVGQTADVGDAEHVLPRGQQDGASQAEDRRVIRRTVLPVDEIRGTTHVARETSPIGEVFRRHVGDTELLPSSKRPVELFHGLPVQPVHVLDTTDAVAASRRIGEERRGASLAEIAVADSLGSSRRAEDVSSGPHHRIAEPREHADSERHVRLIARQRGSVGEVGQRLDAVGTCPVGEQLLAVVDLGDVPAQAGGANERIVDTDSTVSRGVDYIFTSVRCRALWLVIKRTLPLQ